MRNCPHCAKQVQDDASVCPHCQHALAPAGRPGPETRLWSGRPALVSQFGKVSLAALLLVGGVIAVFAFAEGRIAGYLAILLSLLLIVISWLRVITRRYEITTHRAIAREGLFSQTRSEVQLSDVRNVVLVRSIRDRLLGLGTVSLSTSGQSGMELTMRSIRRSQAVVDLVNQQNR